MVNSVGEVAPMVEGPGVVDLLVDESIIVAVQVAVTHIMDLVRKENFIIN